MGLGPLHEKKLQMKEKVLNNAEAFCKQTVRYHL